MLIVHLLQVFKVLFAAYAVTGRPVYNKINQLADTFYDEWFNHIQQGLVVIVIQVFAVLYKAKRTNRADKELSIKRFHSSISINHFINKFSRQLCSVFKGMRYGAVFSQLPGGGKVYTGNS